MELLEERLTATFNDDSTLVLTPDMVGPTITRNQGIIGAAVDLGWSAWKTHDRPRCSST